MTPWAPLKLAPERLGPEIRNPHPKARFFSLASLPELVFNIVVSLEKNPVVRDPSA